MINWKTKKMTFFQTQFIRNVFYINFTITLILPTLNKHYIASL